MMTIPYLHLMYILDPPETAIDGVIDSIQFSKEIPGNFTQQLETLGDIEDMLGIRNQPYLNTFPDYSQVPTFDGTQTQNHCS